MPAALAYSTSPETSNSERGNALVAANDNMPLGCNVPGGGTMPLRYDYFHHLIDENTSGAYPNHSRSANLGNGQTFTQTLTPRLRPLRIQELKGR